MLLAKLHRATDCVEHGSEVGEGKPHHSITTRCAYNTSYGIWNLHVTMGSRVRPPGFVHSTQTSRIDFAFAKSSSTRPLDETAAPHLETR